jgi:hypothetical protein
VKLLDAAALLSQPGLVDAPEASERASMLADHVEVGGHREDLHGAVRGGDGMSVERDQRRIELQGVLERRTIEHLVGAQARDELRRLSDLTRSDEEDPFIEEHRLTVETGQVRDVSLQRVEPIVAPPAYLTRR